VDGRHRAIDIRSLGAGPLENTMQRATPLALKSTAERRTASTYGFNISFPSAGPEPDHARFAKDDCRVGTSAPEPVRIPIDLENLAIGVPRHLNPCNTSFMPIFMETNWGCSSMTSDSHRR
jgi:hypothetical protein